MDKHDENQIFGRFSDKRFGSRLFRGVDEEE
jgi:hypothetical protein